MKRFLIYSIICTLFWAAGVLAFPNMKLQGRVVNGSHDSTAVAKIRVIMQSMTQEDQEPEELGETQTDANGHYTFPLSHPDTSASYFAAVDYMGVRYFSQGQNPMQQTIVVFDTSSGLQNINVVMHHLIIEDVGNAIQVRETRIFNNDGEQAISNFRTHDGVGEYTLRYPLPAGAQEFTPISSPLLVEKDGFIYDKNVMAPGTRQASFAYVIPYHGNKAPLDIKFDMPTRSFDVFLKSKNLAVVSDQLQDQGTFNIRDAEYYRYNAEDLQAGQDVAMQIVQESSPDSSPYPAILITAVLLFGALAVAHVRESGSAKK